MATNELMIDPDTGVSVRFTGFPHEMFAKYDGLRPTQYVLLCMEMTSLKQ